MAQTLGLRITPFAKRFDLAVSPAELCVENVEHNINTEDEHDKPVSDQTDDDALSNI